jgi:O-antigen biosynthesis protein WbqV
MSVLASMKLQTIKSRGWIVFAHDIFMAALSFVLAVYMRLDFWIIEIYSGTWLSACALFTFIAAVVFWASGLYRGVWRYASLNDLWAIIRAVSLTVVIFAFLMFIWVRLEDLPRSVLVIDWFVLMALLGGPRFIYRLMKDRRLGAQLPTHADQIPVLLVGAGDGAELFLRALRQVDQTIYHPIGIISENSGRVGREIHGVQVLDRLENLNELITQLKSRSIMPQRLILTKDDLDGPRLRKLVAAAGDLGLTVARIPKLTDLKAGVADKLEVKPVAIEDLLGRAQVPLNRDAMAQLVQGKRVIVTGAGGSIGAELVRQIAALNPETLMLFDHAEFALYRIDLELSETFGSVNRRAVIGDVRNEAHLARLFEDLKPEIVFHAAALKHVPMVEDNILEGLATNVLGTINVADACLRHDVSLMVMISTDKAVNPTNVMGASKRLAECYCQANDLARAEQENIQTTRFITVRFGNVLGSTGSVVPLFQRQLEQGGPITVTDKRMTRYFMTIREAVELVLQAAALSASESGDEVPPGNICVLEMGEPVKIVDLARQMIRLAGLEPDKDIRIDVVGIRPGEKLFEEIFHGSEPLVPTQSAGILLAAPRTADLTAIKAVMARLKQACDGFNLPDALDAIRELVPEFSGYTPGHKGQSDGPSFID